MGALRKNKLPLLIWFAVLVCFAAVFGTCNVALADEVQCTPLGEEVVYEGQSDQWESYRWQGRGNNRKRVTDGYVSWALDMNGCLTVSSTDLDDVFQAFNTNTKVKSILFKGSKSGNVSAINGVSYDKNRFPNLESVTIDSTSVTTLNAGCFAMCEKLASVDLSGAPSIKTLSSSSADLFLGCKSLKTLDLSETGITTIEQGPFSGSYLESITLPKGLTTLGQNALADCGQSRGKGTYGDAEKGIKSIVVPSSVTTIGQNAFSNLLGLKVVYLPAGITSFNNSQDTTTTKASADHSEPTFSKEYVVYNNPTTTDPAWVTALWNGTDDKGTGAWKKNTAMHKETFSYPLGVVNQIEAAAAVTSFEDMTNEIITGLL